MINIVIKNLSKSTNLTFCYRTLCKVSTFKEMEGFIVKENGEMGWSPNKKLTPGKKTTFVGISPQKELTNITTPTDRPFRVAIEGNIGSGKSSLLNYFANFPNIETYPEPLDWWRNLDGHNLLDLLYTDIHKWYNTFQMYVQFTRLRIKTEPPKSSSTRVQMYERSVQSNRFCFVEHARKHGFLHPAEYANIDEWYKWAKKTCDIELDLIVYLRSTPEVVFQRMKSRRRSEESTVQLEYLQQLHESYEEWLMTDDFELNTIPVLVLDADRTLEEVYEQFKINETKILGRDTKGTQSVRESHKEHAKKVLDLS